MSAEYEPLESYYASRTLGGLIRSGYTLLKARRVRQQSEAGSFHLADLRDRILYISEIVGVAVFLDLFQRIRTWATGRPRAFPQGSWQFYLHWAMREDLAHHTCETVGYHRERPSEATELDDLAAWTMAAIQFLWSYEYLMGIVWDEWTVLRLVVEASKDADLEYDELFHRLPRQWEVAIPYTAPLNGTYADMRQAAFEEFMAPRLEVLPDKLWETVTDNYKTLAQSKRKSYQKQMSLLARLLPKRFLEVKEPMSLWDACIAVVIGGQYYLIDVAAHDEMGSPVVYGQGGTSWPLQFRDGKPIDPTGEELTLQDDQLYRKRDSEWVGYLDMASISCVKWQLQQILENTAFRGEQREDYSADILLAETPRPIQKRLRGLLPLKTQKTLEQLSGAPIIINWSERPRDRSLAELRRAHRGIGDHALTIMRTEDSIIFDQSHMFFDGTWSLAMAEVLTSAAVQWCKRCITIPVGASSPPRLLEQEVSVPFTREAHTQRQAPEISAETTIWDISQITKLRQMLSNRGMRLTVNDLLVITRIFHAAHYKPSPAVQTAIESFRSNAQSPIEKRAAAAIERSLERGRVTNPALLIPVNASLVEPHERLYQITFRNLLQPRSLRQDERRRSILFFLQRTPTTNLVTVWDDTWDAYQAYRRIEPPDTPEGIQAFDVFARKRAFLLGSLLAFSHLLAANKAVALRGDSFNYAILKLLVGLPSWLQRLLNAIPEQSPALNEILKGDEVYSNVGRVAKGSSLTRFMTAKDDGNTKALAWGVMTDDENRLIITMRDFRPHVKPLARAKRNDLSHRLAQDYVVSYTADLIGLVARLSAMLQVEKPTVSAK